MLDPNDTISRLQSGSVRASIIQIVLGVLSIVSVFTGIVFDVEVIKTALENGVTIVTSALSVYLAYKAYKGRVEAQKQIEPLPWRQEIKTLVKKD